MTTPIPAGLGPLREVEDRSLILDVVEERLAVAKRRVAGEIVRVSTATEVVEAIAEVELDRYRVEVVHVPVGRVVDEVPLARAEGDTTIVPVVEERLVLVKQLFLKEELHIRHIVEREVKRETVALRRQHATVERSAVDRSVLDRPEGRAAVESDQPRTFSAAEASPQATKAPLR